MIAFQKGRERGDARRPIMFDFDHPVKSIRHEIRSIMQEFGFRGNFFIHTGATEEI